MNISLKGFDSSAATFEISGEIAIGAPVKISANNTVSACAAGDDFIGAALTVRDSLAGVQLTGAVTLPFSGTAPALGYTAIAADGAGGVKALTSGRKMLVVAVDSAAGTADIIL